MRWKKRKLGPFPPIPASALESTVGLDSLKKLSDDDLKAALAMANDIEAWCNTMAKGYEKLEKDHPMAEPFIAAGMHTRVAREVMAIFLTLRDEGKGGYAGPPGPNGKPGPRGGGYL